MDPILLMMAILLALTTDLMLITTAGSICIWIHVYPRLKAVPIHPYVPPLVYGYLLMLIPLAHAVVVFLMMLIRRFFTRCTAGIESCYFGASGEAIEFSVKTAMLKGIGFKEKIDELSRDLTGNVLDRATANIMKARVRLEPYIP